MENSNHLKLPYILPAQAQKHVTHNEAIRILDGLVQLAVLSADLAEPPASAAEGERYIIADNPAGAWAGRERQVACLADGAWLFSEPSTGWIAFVEDRSVFLVFRDGAWTGMGDLVAGAITALESLATIGINAGADSTNRLAVAADASLFTHEGNGHQLKVNKAAQGDTASLLFQNNWTGHAEMGLAGNNDFSVKVSADGSQWKPALSIDPVSGKVDFPFGQKSVQLHGVPATLNAYDFLYIDAVNGDDANDGLTNVTALRSFGALEQRLPVGRRVQIRLLSDIVCNHVLQIHYMMPLIEIYGRNSTDSAFETRRVEVVNATNFTNYCGGFFFNCHAAVYLRNLDLELKSTNSGSFLDFFNTTGFVRTFATNVDRSANAACKMMASGGSFVPSSHAGFTIQPAAQGHVASGVAAGQNPNDDWRYPCNLTAL